MPVPSAPGPFVRAGFVAVVVTAVWWAMALVTAMPPLWPLGPQPAYTAADAPALVSLEPVLHAPWLGTPASPIVWLVATVVMLGASGVALFAGATTLAALGVLAALVLDPSFNAALAHAGGLAIAVGLVWLAAGAAFDDRSRLFRGRPWFNPLSAMLLWALAVWWDWIAVVTWPVVLAAFRRTPERPGRGWWTLGSLILGTAAFVGHFAGMVDAARALSFDAGAVGTWRDALSVAFDARPRMPVGSFATPEVSTRLGSVSIVLAGVGLCLGSLGRWWRPAVLLSAALALGVGLVWSEWQAEVFRFALWALAPLSAVGLTWVAAQGRRPVAVTLVLATIAASEHLAVGARALNGTDARLFRDAFVLALERRAQTGPLAIVAEDTRVDSALVPWMAEQPQVQRVLQDGDAVSRARANGRTVLAASTARRHLELAGISFTDGFVIGEPAPFVMFEADGAFRCAQVRADRWSQLPGLEYTGRLGIAMPARLGGELHLVVGDDLVLPLHAATPDGRTVSFRQELLLSGPGASAPPADYWIDGGDPDDGTHWVRRVRLAADPLRPTLLSLDLGRRAPRVIARLDGYDDEARGRVCAAPLGPVYLRLAGEEVLPLHDERLLGTGWHGREGEGSDAFRWAEPDAVVLLRSAAKADVTVALDVSPAVPSDAGGETSVTLRVNGIDVGTQIMPGGGRRYIWQVPAGVWLAGANELWWHTSRAVRPADRGGTDARLLALRVTGITVSRAGGR